MPVTIKPRRLTRFADEYNIQHLDVLYNILADGCHHPFTRTGTLSNENKQLLLDMYLDRMSYKDYELAMAKMLNFKRMWNLWALNMDVLALLWVVDELLPLGYCSLMSLKKSLKLVIKRNGQIDTSKYFVR